MPRNLSDSELEDAVLSIENLICKTFNESQRKFWKFCLSKYSYDVIVHCWHEFSEKLNPNEFPNWQHLEPIFRHYHNKINSFKDIPKEKPSVQDQKEISMMIDACKKGMNLGSIERELNFAKTFEKLNDNDAVEYFHFKVNKLKKEGANYEGK